MKRGIRAIERDLAGEDDERFGAAMSLCQDPSVACASRGACSYDGDCFKPSRHDFRAAERVMNKAIAEVADPAVASWLHVGLAAMRRFHRDEIKEGDHG